MPAFAFKKFMAAPTPRLSRVQRMVGLRIKYSQSGLFCLVIASAVLFMVVLLRLLFNKIADKKSVARYGTVVVLAKIGWSDKKAAA